MAIDISAQATQKFLDAIRLNGTDGYRSLWRLSDRGSDFFSVTDTGAYARRAFDIRTQSDLYYSAGVLGSIPEKGRGIKRDIIAIPGVWLDLDSNNNPNHPKEGFPATIEDVLVILRRFKLQPSIVVYSGGGVQAWWLFDRLWRFTDDKDRAEAEDLLNRWRLAFNQEASPYRFDAVADVSRVLRLPGSRNFKFASPVTAGLLYLGENRYTVAQLQSHVATVKSTVVKPAEMKAYAQIEIKREGSGRNNRLWSFAGLIRDAVSTEDSMYAVLDTFNHAEFIDPLEDQVVRGMATRIMKYEAEPIPDGKMPEGLRPWAR